MKYAYDLHIHSVLSACADDLMTPNNILNMASLKGLDIVAVTDHNSLKQLPVLDEIAQSYAFLFVYGVEVCVKEEIHVLCYFKTLADALRFDGELEQRIDSSIPPLPDEGTSRLTDQEDFIKAIIPYSLSRPLNLTLAELVEILQQYDHVRYFAHLERPKFGGLVHVHQVPMHGIELSINTDQPKFVRQHHLESMHVICNSDAHQLMDIRERSVADTIELETLDIDCLFRALRS